MRTDPSATASPALTDRHPDLRAAQQPPTIPPTSAPCHRSGVAVAFATKIQGCDAMADRDPRSTQRSRPQSEGLHVQMAASARLPMASAASIPRRDTMGDLESRRKSQRYAFARGRDLNGKKTEHSDHSGGRWVCSGAGGGWATHLGSWRRWGSGGGASVGFVLY
ncbi:hypothetical protein NL676_022554 [Syzygium grande]|nr:hypothetical protein NL676_022554 [Syzygium grande]